MYKRRAGRAPHARKPPARPSCPSALHLRPLSRAPTLIRRRYSSADGSIRWPARCDAASRPPSARGGRAAVEQRCSWLAAGPAAQPPWHAQVRRSRRRASALARARRDRRALAACSRGLPEELGSAAAAWLQRAYRALRRRIGRLRCRGEAHAGGDGRWGAWAVAPALLGLCGPYRGLRGTEVFGPCDMGGLF